jgi:Predicted membrane protein
MDQSVVQSNVDDAVKRGDESDDTVVTVVEHAIVHPHSSYHLTRWPVINRLLDFVDKVTHGRADLVMRFVSYLFFGGTAALVNLAVFALGLVLLPASFDPFTRTLVADIIACEVSLIANFIPNDYFTFRYMAGRQRPWIIRCARFHMTGMVGFLLTVILQQFFSHGVHIYPLLGQALAILIVLIYNFTFHHLFTYRHMATHAPTIH